MVTTMMMRCRSWWTQERRSKVATITAGTLPFRSLQSTVMGMASILIEVASRLLISTIAMATTTGLALVASEIICKSILLRYSWLMSMHVTKRHPFTFTQRPCRIRVYVIFISPVYTITSLSSGEQIVLPGFTRTSPHIFHSFRLTLPPHLPYHTL